MPMFNFPKIKALWMPRCQLCQQAYCLPETPLCKACNRDIPWLLDSFTIQEVKITAVCHYDWPIDRLIHQFKYQQHVDYLPLLTHLLLRTKRPAVHAIVPVPLSDQRLRERGFNQSLLLARQLSKHWKIPVWQPLQRQHRVAQQHLDRHERLINLEQAFTPQSTRNKITPRKILLLDDVVTTGSTLFHMSESLQQLGVKQCQGLVIARA